MSDALLVVVGLAAIFSAAGSVLYPALLDRIVDEERGRNPRQSMGQILRGLPHLRLVVADIVFAVVVTLGLLAFVVPGIIVGLFEVHVADRLTDLHLEPVE